MRTYGRLREKIREKFGTIGAFSLAIEKDTSSISKKLNGHVPWDQNDIEKSCNLLDIPIGKVPEYFFYDE